MEFKKRLLLGYYTFTPNIGFKRILSPNFGRLTTLPLDKGFIDAMQHNKGWNKYTRVISNKCLVIISQT